jgi:hypothetical protein
MLDDKPRHTWTMAFSIEDIKVGSYIGTGAMKDGRAATPPSKITVFPESARGVAVRSGLTAGPAMSPRCRGSGKSRTGCPKPDGGTGSKVSA